MNRRTVLQSAGVVGTLALAGCLDGVQDHFEGSLQGVVPIEIHSEADRYYSLQIEAHARETNRQAYSEEVTVTAGESVGLSHLEGIEQSLRVVKFDGRTNEELDVQEVSVSPNTELVLIRLYDDDLVIEIERGDNGERAEQPDRIENREQLEEVRGNDTASAGNESETDEGGIDDADGADTGDADTDGADTGDADTDDS